MLRRSSSWESWNVRGQEWKRATYRPQAIPLWEPVIYILVGGLTFIGLLAKGLAHWSGGDCCG